MRDWLAAVCALTLAIYLGHVAWYLTLGWLVP